MAYLTFLRKTLKLCIFFIFLFKYFFYSNNLLIYKDNQLYQYEENIDFSNYKTDIKAIVNF
jgi:hypothetical protein